MCVESCFVPWSFYLPWLTLAMCIRTSVAEGNWWYEDHLGACRVKQRLCSTAHLDKALVHICITITPNFLLLRVLVASANNNQSVVHHKVHLTIPSSHGFELVSSLKTPLLWSQNWMSHGLRNGILPLCWQCLLLMTFTTYPFLPTTVVNHFYIMFKEAAIFFFPHWVRTFAWDKVKHYLNLTDNRKMAFKWWKRCHAGFLEYLYWAF